MYFLKIQFKKTGEISRAALHNYVQSVTYNNNKIYFFRLKKSEWNIVRTTVEDENNGLWEVDIETGTKKRSFLMNVYLTICLQQKIIFIATEKTIYCHEEWLTIGIRDIV